MRQAERELQGPRLRGPLPRGISPMTGDAPWTRADCSHIPHVAKPASPPPGPCYCAGPLTGTKNARRPCALPAALHSTNRPVVCGLLRCCTTSVRHCADVQMYRYIASTPLQSSTIPPRAHLSHPGDQDFCASPISLNPCLQFIPLSHTFTTSVCFATSPT